MTLFPRRLQPVAQSPVAAARGVAFSATLIVAALLATLLLCAAPARAVVNTELPGVRVGLQPRNGESVLDATLTENTSNVWANTPVPHTFENPLGNPVLHGTNLYAIYWDPMNRYDGDWQHVINTFFQSVGAASGSTASVFGVDAQYTDRSNLPAAYQASYHTAYTDTHVYPVSPGCTDPRPLKKWREEEKAITCLTDSQLQQELARFITAENLPKGMNSVYYLLTPPGVAVCLDAGATHCSDFTRSAEEETKNEFASETYKKSFCSYHADINPGGTESGDGNTILYAAIPWTAGLVGDSHFALADRTQSYHCQDGGFDPSSRPTEQREIIKPRNAKEQKEFTEKTPEEQEQLEKDAALQGPHIQEPNQVGCPSPDGACDTGLADLIVNQIAVEQQNVVTNPLLNAWQDSSHNEATDECRNFFSASPSIGEGPPGKIGGSVGANPETGAGTLFNQTLHTHNYYLNTAFNFAGIRLAYPAVPCLSAVTLEPQFTAPTTVNTGEVVGFDGMESNISLNSGVNYTAGGSAKVTYATYTWNFGDGSATVTGYAPGDPTCEGPWISPCAASVFHTYKYGGTYPVTLTVTDVGGHEASVTNPVTVNGPSKESSAGGGSAVPGAAGGGSQTSGGSSPSSSPGATAPPVAKPKPVVAAAAVSRSLRGVLRHGLTVRYSVSEQVVGHFEVLLASSVARRLGLRGPAATGLAPGSAPQIVIGKAILVTTKGGRNTAIIQFTKRTASRLATLRHVSLQLRLVVRNASNQTVTVIATVPLSH